MTPPEAHRVPGGMWHRVSVVLGLSTWVKQKRNKM